MEPLPTRTSGLGIFLPKPASEIVNVWRQQLDPSYEYLAPHITIAYPPFIAPERWNEIRSVVAASLAPFHPFDVTLQEVGMFNGDPYVLWLRPDDNGILIRMRKALEVALPEVVPALPFTYQPHVSIGFFQDSEALQQAYAKVRSELAPIYFKVFEICYGSQEFNNRWQVYDRIKLEGQTASTTTGKNEHESTH